MTTVIHKRRTKHAHLNTVYIGRGTKWGNPFVIGTHGDRAQVVELHRRWLAGDPEVAAMVPGLTPPTVEEIRRELAGRVLACWCKPAACHGDTLAGIADQPTTTGTSPVAPKEDE